MLPHIIWNTANIVEGTIPIEHIFGGICVHHFVHQSSSVEKLYKQINVLISVAMGETVLPESGLRYQDALLTS
jgi:hypothetical protein